MTEPHFDLESKSTDAFEEVDPFNPENTVRGFIHKSGQNTYGAMRITHVNGEEVVQNIWCTPKMGYPWDKYGFYKVDPGASIDVYEKLDGTNVCAYSYYGADGKQFVSYKTRLKPFLGEGKFGAFKDMWSEVLQKYPRIPDMIRRSGMNLSFELFGSRNKILIQYSVPLDTKLLFGITDGGKIIPPWQILGRLSRMGSIKDMPEPTVQLDQFWGGPDFEERYKALRARLNENLITVKVPDGDIERIEKMEGMEGAVLYIVTDGAIQFKAKPDEVQDIHWADRGPKIPYHSIYTTIINAFEETDDVTLEHVKKLLEEEFKSEDIEEMHNTIKRLLTNIEFDLKLKDEVVVDYRRMGFDIMADKRACMSWFGQNYDKKLATKIYQLLMAEFGVVKEK